MPVHPLLMDDYANHLVSPSQDAVDQFTQIKSDLKRRQRTVMHDILQYLMAKLFIYIKTMLPPVQVWRLDLCELSMVLLS